MSTGMIITVSLGVTMCAGMAGVVWCACKAGAMADQMAEAMLRDALARAGADETNEIHEHAAGASPDPHACGGDAVRTIPNHDTDGIAPNPADSHQPQIQLREALVRWSHGPERGR